MKIGDEAPGGSAKKKLLVAVLFVVLPAFAQEDSQWVLAGSTLTYHMSHPLHQVDGVSHAARGKGVCHAGKCDFLIAAPVKSFDSGDSNRDLHMLQVTRGAQYPIVSVRLQLRESEIASPTVNCDLEIQFAGQTAHFARVAFSQTIQGSEHHITGSIPSTLTDFKLDPPTFLTMPIKNEIPVRVEMTWRPI